MVSVITILRGVTDPRRGNATRHALLDVLTIALTASICGCESCVEFADFAEDRETLFREFLSFKNGLPSHDTFSRLFRLIDPAALSTCFGRFLEALGADGAGVIAIDGKTLRRSFDRAAGTSALHVVTAFASEARLVLGQKAVKGEGNEITAARELLELIDCRGALVTADALHCNAPTAAAILARGGDYLLALKANRPTTLRDVKDYLADPRAAIAHAYETTDANHGRIEVRRHVVVHDVDWLFGRAPDKDTPPLPGLKTIGRVEAIVERDGKTTRSTRFYLSSATLSAQAFASAARAHWGIENGLHWVLDMAFDEDRARARKDHAAENLAIIRKLALNLLKTARPAISIRRKRKRSGWTDAFARTILGQMR
jgi:predicted transposase YbfD/YdcC